MLGPAAMFVRSAPSRQRLRAPGAIVLLLALLWQGLVVGTHVHLPATAPVALGVSAVPVASERQQSPLLADRPCPLCAAAHQADLALPPVATLPRASAVPALLAPSPFAAMLRHPRSHAWHSRGPPRA